MGKKHIIEKLRYNEDRWWEPLMPKISETWEDYVRRAIGFEQEFVMMEHKPDDIDIIGRAQQLLATRHAFVPGKYVCFAIRDLVFLAYTTEWREDAW